MRDMHHPLPRMGRQIDLVMPRQFLKVAFDVRLLHEAEAQLNADHATAFFVAVKYDDAIAILVNIGDLRVDDLNQNEVSWKDAVPVP